MGCPFKGICLCGNWDVVATRLLSAGVSVLALLGSLELLSVGCVKFF